MCVLHLMVGQIVKVVRKLALKNVNLIAILLTLNFLTSQFSTSFVIWNVGLSDFVF